MEDYLETKAKESQLGLIDIGERLTAESRGASEESGKLFEEEPNLKGLRRHAGVLEGIYVSTHCEFPIGFMRLKNEGP